MRSDWAHGGELSCLCECWLWEPIEGFNGFNTFLHVFVYFVCMYKCVCGAVVAMVPVWKPEDNMWESALPFYLWALGIKFKLSGLVADTVNY